MIKYIFISLSRIDRLRNFSSHLHNIYHAYVLADDKALKLLNVIKYNRNKAFYFWRWAPLKYWGGGILNLFGLSLIRYFFHNCKYGFRFLQKKIPYPKLKKDGLEILPNLISKDLVDELLKFHKDHKEDIIHHFDDFSELIICNTKRPNFNRSNGWMLFYHIYWFCKERNNFLYKVFKYFFPKKNIKKFDFIKAEEYSKLTDKILNEALLLEIGKKITGKNISLQPFVSIIHSKSEIYNQIQEDGQNTPHRDVFYPSYKIFIYLNKVNEDNGAFRYLIGSHEFSFKNAINCYKDTFRFYFHDAQKLFRPSNATLGLNLNKYKWAHANGDYGDGVLFNVQGIHRRGEFKKDKYRERLVLLIDFRQVETPVQRFAADV